MKEEMDMVKELEFVTNDPNAPTVEQAVERLTVMARPIVEDAKRFGAQQKRSMYAAMLTDIRNVGHRQLFVMALIEAGAETGVVSAANLDATVVDN